jgi:plasmid stabilization system protein ParE
MFSGLLPKRAAQVEDDLMPFALWSQPCGVFVESGLPGRVDGTRELVIDRIPYIAAYRVAGVSVQILRVLHGAQQRPEDIPQK